MFTTDKGEWLSDLSPRDIVWLMLQLREQAAWSAPWFTPETARTSIDALRKELLQRREEIGTPAL